MAQVDAPSLPLYRRLTRKEARLREEQLRAVTELRRRLNLERSEGSEAFTDNSVIRVAVDLLLRVSEEVAGSNEQELLASALVAQQVPESLAESLAEIRDRINALLSTECPSSRHDPRVTGSP